MDFSITKKQFGLIVAGAVVLGLLIGGFTMTYVIKDSPLHKQVVVDTSYIVTKVPLDLAASLKPVSVIPYKAEPVTLHDTVFVDRPYIKDSLVYIPISKGMYYKNDVTVWATGYQVTIDSVRALVPVRERTITNTITQSYNNEIAMGLGVSTIFTGTYKIPNAALEFSWDKGGNHTFVKIGASYIDKVNLYLETGYYIKFYKRKH